MSVINEQKERMKNNPVIRIFQLLLLILILILGIPSLIDYLIADISLRFKFRKVATRQARFILFVYSDSRIWKSYIEQNLLPSIEDHAIILNWSERSQWKMSWAVQAFHHWGGEKDFNPMAIVFCNLAKVRVFRFYSAFYEYQHGKITSLQKVESEFLELVKASIKT